MEEIIYIGSDHAGFRLKGEIRDFLLESGYRVEDIGPNEYDPHDDYPDYALKVCEMVRNNGGKGILICGSGHGMNRVANKIPGIHASVCWNEESARMAKEHGDINVLCMGERLVEPETAKRIVSAWLETEFSREERHLRRVGKIMEIEKRYMRV